MPDEIRDKKAGGFVMSYIFIHLQKKMINMSFLRIQLISAIGLAFGTIHLSVRLYSPPHLILRKSEKNGMLKSQS